MVLKVPAAPDPLNVSVFPRADKTYRSTFPKFKTLEKFVFCTFKSQSFKDQK